MVPPGVVIPSTPWEALWNGVAQWFGVTTSSSLDEVVPNRQTFSSNLFSQSDLYKGTFTDPPTSASTPSPSSAPITSITTPDPSSVPSSVPSSAPVTSITKAPTPTNQPLCNTEAPTVDPPHSCLDSPLKFQFVNGTERVFYNCEWVRDDPSRCDLNKVKFSCPATCGVCNECRDSRLKFKLFTGDQVLKRSCKHIGRNKELRCKYYGIGETCRETCSTCSNVV